LSQTELSLRGKIILEVLMMDGIRLVKKEMGDNLMVNGPP
jgi:hypothetical protein